MGRHHDYVRSRLRDFKANDGVLGQAIPGLEKCPHCRGHGKLSRVPGGMRVSPCSGCDGTGWIRSED